ncbi:hypothetical protein FOZ60_011020 [Perkinsus olseni]|uniref:Uncharacterized protein n=1 Tax=Perkinsus olseni TaxID=32597 RepID=A0A7J6NE16_PEROL|nr:hypothetical protein FOZ60_011020 [Perkinsus olseni]
MSFEAPEAAGVRRTQFALRIYLRRHVDCRGVSRSVISVTGCSCGSVTNWSAKSRESVAAPDPSDPPFPPMKYADGMPELRGGIVCGNGDGKARDGNSRSFSFNFQADRGAQTEEIICPETPRLEQYRVEFSFGQNVLSKFEFGFPHFDYAKALWRYTFKAPPPEGTGLDPLRNISETSFTQQLESVSLATRRLDKPRDGGERITQDVLFGIGNGIAALGEMRKACADAMAIVKTEYPTFTGLCKEYLNMSNAAIKAAGSSEEWTFRGKENARLVYPIFHPDIVVKEGSAYRSILRPFGFGFLDKYGLWELPK